MLVRSATYGQQLLDNFVHLLDRSFRHEHDIRVVQPNIIGRHWAACVQGAAQVEHCGHQTPIGTAAEDHDLPQVRAWRPTTG